MLRYQYARQGKKRIDLLTLDANGGQYTCKGCGQPMRANTAGSANLTWKQWCLLKPGLYTTATHPRTASVLRDVRHPRKRCKVAPEEFETF